MHRLLDLGNRYAKDSSWVKSDLWGSLSTPADKLPQRSLFLRSLRKRLENLG